MQVSTVTKPTTTGSQEVAPVFPPGRTALFVLVTVLFFLWGMSNNLTDILVQQFKKSFELSQFGAQLVQTANFLGYFCMAIPAALVMRRWGYKAGMVMGLVFFGGGMVLFWPAAATGAYVPFLIALFTVGCGASVLETAANPFMAQFGPAATSERRLNFAQAFNPPGTILGVVVGARFIFSGIEASPSQVAAMKAAGTYKQYLHDELVRVVPTYLVLGTTVLLFALLLSRMSFPPMASESQDSRLHQGSRHLSSSIELPSFVAGCIGKLLQCWSANLHVEQPHTLHEAIHIGERTDGRSISDRYPRGSDAGPICNSAFDEIRLRKFSAGGLWSDECFADGRRDTPSGYVGCLRHCGEQLFPFHYVPNNLRARVEGPG